MGAAVGDGAAEGVGRAARGPAIGAALVVPPCARRGSAWFLSAPQGSRGRGAVTGVTGRCGARRGPTKPDSGEFPAELPSRRHRATAGPNGGAGGAASADGNGAPRTRGGGAGGGGPLQGRSPAATGRVPSGGAEPRPQALHLEAREKLFPKLRLLRLPRPLEKGEAATAPQRRSPGQGLGRTSRLRTAFSRSPLPSRTAPCSRLTLRACGSLRRSRRFFSNLLSPSPPSPTSSLFPRKSTG